MVCVEVVMTTWHRVCIETGGNVHSDYLPWFQNFMDKSGFYGDDRDIDFYLKPYRARNVRNTPYIEFETEQDYTWFVLRWS